MSSWAVRLVFSPVVWAGVVVAGVSVALFAVSGFLRRRSPKPTRAERRAAEAGDQPAAVTGPLPARATPAVRADWTTSRRS